MRVIVAVFAAMMILPVFASPAHGSAAYLGLYVDGSHLQSCIPNPNFSRHYTVWAWCQPTGSGVQYISFAVIWDGGFDRGAMTVNTSIVSSTNGVNLLGGMEFFYSSCQYDWHWVYKEDISHVDPTRVGSHLWIEEGVVGHAGCVRTCHPDEYRAFGILTNAYFGWCSVIGVESSTWGAIKSLYRE